MGAILDLIAENIYKKPEFYLKKIKTKSGKEALRIDVFAENKFRKFVTKDMPDVYIFGEESEVSNLNLVNENRLCALVDMVDGTDLLERRLYNWCSSAVFFDPRLPADEEKIIAAFIGVPPKDVYFATKGKDGAFVLGSDGVREVAGCSLVTSLNDASICFYGQKGKRLVSESYQKLFQHIKNLEKLRIYTLAGMPMIVKLIDKIVKNASGIDAVFDFVGQNPHDVVPGAYLAMKAGATVRNLNDNEEMTFKALEKILMTPFNKEVKMKYITASTPELAKEIESLYSG